MAEETPKPKKGYRFAPTRPAPSRDDLLRILRADEPVSYGEVQAALADGRLTNEEAGELITGWKESEDQMRALSGESLIRALGLDRMTEIQDQWRQQMKSITDSLKLKPAVPLGALLKGENVQLAALRDLRVELAGVAQVLETSGEQIGVTAKLAAATVASLDLVHGETKALREDLRDSNSTVTRLTFALVGLGAATVVLTAVLVWLTWVLTHPQH